MKKINYNLLWIVVFLLLVFITGVNVHRSDTGFLFDNSIMDYLYSIRKVNTVNFMKIITNLGSKYFFLLALLGLGFYFFKRKEVRNLIILINSIVGSYLLNAVLKISFSRIRPPLSQMVIQKTSYSFPSGHAMVSMSFYTSMTYIFLKNIKNKYLKLTIWIFNFIIIGLIGFSRLYLGVHWPTDVICGYLMGLIVFYFGKEKVGRS